MVPVVNGALIYTDLIKMQIATEFGQTLNFDATNYLVNYKKRAGEIFTPKLKPADLKSKIVDENNIISTNLALIPKSTIEVLTYEFIVKTNDKTAYVYINANTGNIEKTY
jgi:germination protein YpeB